MLIKCYSAEEHSRKPKYLIDTINEMFFNVKKLEIFSRCSKYLDWDTWGDEKFELGRKDFPQDMAKNMRIIQQKNYEKIKNKKKNENLKEIEGFIIKYTTSKFNKKQKIIKTTNKRKTNYLTQTLTQMKKKKII